MKLRSRWIAAALFVACAAPYARAGAAPDIRTVQYAVDARYHAHGYAIPMMWMASWIARGVTGGGVRGMHVVTYEHFTPRGRDTLLPLVRAQLSPAWSLMVRDRETAKDGEDDTVWVQPHGKRIRMLVISLEADELDLVQMDLSPQALARWEKEHSR